MGRAMTLFLLRWEEGAAETLYYLIQSDGDDQMNRLALTLLAAKKEKNRAQRSLVCRKMNWTLSHQALSRILRSLKRPEYIWFLCYSV